MTTPRVLDRGGGELSEGRRVTGRRGPGVVTRILPFDPPIVRVARDEGHPVGLPTWPDRDDKELFRCPDLTLLPDNEKEETP